ncbi:cadherin-like domain-containing protein [Agrobacterium tumefaciens]|jgi:Ca2+-binding RTX toxin-like protein|uniref:calcium-binding protein n=1 Tax=Agrobacterium tumefaciens TaxID=358 RepID=UPI0015716346|nr:cadherin-like domain-containing protein [Agrobacterium tumefaciens]NTE68984.1 cadherin-like domain-containing protein [Agrobacterium tumefaciens]NUL18524.1 cadherin-like domain-containing protein [Agrobacterium tumefaciens]
MEDKLVLGLPDVAASIAPKNRFELHDKPVPRYWSIMNPAVALAAIGAFFGKLRSETQVDGPNAPLAPLVQGPVAETETRSNEASTNIDIIEEVAAYLRQVAEEAGNAERKVRFLAETTTFPSSFHARADLNLDNHSFRSLLQSLSANDNHRINGYFAPLTTLGVLGNETPIIWHAKDQRSENASEPEAPRADPDENPRDHDGPAAGESTPPAGNARPNRLPVVAGRVFLGSGLMNLSALILLDNLASAATDADDDTLSVRNLQVSSGIIQTYGEGIWLYTPDRGYIGEVTFSYSVSDGIGSVSATAMLDLVKAAPHPVEGTDKDDILLGTPGDDVIAALDGNDFVYGRESNDVIYGGNGDDTLMGGSGNDTIYGEGGHDRISGGGGDDVIFGGVGNDEMYGEEGDDVVAGGDGDDMASGGAGNDHLFGDEGDDTLSGDAGDDLLDGGNGNDMFSSGLGHDAVIAGAGNDIIVIGPGAEEARAAAQLPAVNDGDDTYSGGDGFDTYDASSASKAVEIDLAAKTASGSQIGTDHIDGFEAAIGGSGNDTLNGNDEDNLLVGGAGDDHLTAGKGNDTVSGDAGDDTVVVLFTSSGSDDGNDQYSGGDGIDTYDVSATITAVIIDLEEGTATGVEIGTDQLEGFEAAIAGLGNDVLVANSDINFLTGGAGNDVFIFRSVEAVLNDGQGRDKILDFQIGDRIDLSDLADEIGGLMFDRIMGEINDQQDVRRIRLYSEFADGETAVVRAVIDLAGEQDDLELLIYSHQALTEDDFILAARDDDAGLART